MKSGKAGQVTSKAKPGANAPVMAAVAASYPTETGGRRWAVIAALFFGTVLLFARAVGHDFVNYDDPDYVTANEYVRAGVTIAGLKWAFFSGDISYWHPLTWVSHMVDWQLYGNRAAGHHATSVAWHALAAVMAFLALRRLTGAFWTSAACAALFAWHPLRVESVAWVAERKDVLGGFFWMTALWAYAGYAEQRRQGRRGAWEYAGALAAFAGGLMSKPMLVTLPCVLLLLDFWPVRRAGGDGATKMDAAAWGKLVLEKVPFFVLSAAVSWITVVAQKQVGTLSTVLTLGERLSNAAVAVVRYGAKFFVPVDLAVLYPHPGQWPAEKVGFAVMCIAAVSALAVWQWRRRPWIVFGWLWFLGTLVPVSGIVQVGIQSMADRYTYVPMLGAQIALLWTLREWVGPAAWRTAAWVGLAVLAGCAVRTFGQIGVWRNSFTLFDQAIAVTERNYLAHNNRGTWLFDAGRVDEAIADYRKSLAINPRYEEAANNLGHALAQQGKTAEAIEHYRAALRLKPELVEAHNNLGNALSDLGQIDEAITHYEFALARRPDHADALNNYGVALAMKGRMPEAIARIERALQLAPDKISAHCNLGNVCAMMGKHEEAVAHYRRALALNPNDARTHNNVGNVLAQQGKLTEAVASYEQAIRLEAVNPEAHANLGFALARLERRDDAARHLRTALQQRPDYAQAKAWLDALLGTPPAVAR